MFKLKRICSLLLILILIVSGQQITFADSSGIIVNDIDGKYVSVQLDFGNEVAEKLVGIEILRPNGDITAIASDEDVVATFAKLDTVVTDDNGKASAEILFSAPSGNYKIIAGRKIKKLETMFPFINANDVKEIAEGLKNGNIGLKDIFNSTGDEDLYDAFEILGLNDIDAYDVYIAEDDIKSDAQTYFSDDKSDISLNDSRDDNQKSVQALFEKSVYKSAVINSKKRDVVTKILSENASVIGFDASVVYKDIYSDNKICDKSIISDISDYIVSKEWTNEEKTDFLSTLEKAILLSVLSENEVYGEIAQIITKSKDILVKSGLDWSAYDKVSNKQKIHRDIASLDKNEYGLKFTTLNDFAQYINDKTGGQTSDDDDDYGSSSSSSGSSGKRGSGSSVSFGGVQAPVNNISEVSKADLFKDLDSEHWAMEAIKYLADKEIVNGKSETRFAPNDNITREEIAKILVLAFELTGKESSEFTDVDENAWYYDYVTRAAASGIINGYGDSFGVGDFVTRQDLATICYRILTVAKIRLEQGEMTFTDSSEISDYALKAVNALSNAGIINGVGDGRFNPKGTATRAQAAKIIYQTILLKEAK